MREQQVETFFRDGVRRMGGFAYKFVSPGNAGVPDRLVLWPNGKVIFVELKAEKGELSRMQEVQLSRIRSLGHQAEVLCGIGEVKAFLARMKRGDAL